MAHLTVRGSLCRGVSCNESKKTLAAWICWQNKDGKLLCSYGFVDVIIM